jgi:DNA repair protein RecN (Recombination protein N)
MADYAAGIEHDPARLDEIRRRQDLIFRLKSKYGPQLEDVLATGRAAREELELAEGAEWELSALQKREAAARGELECLAAELSQRRLAAARTLAEEVGEILPQLGMSGGRFEAVALPLDVPGAAGAEEIEFRVALNKGFEPRPLASVASGGELSRVMLALKTILARLDAVPTLIFDEVDAGIGGRVALQVGEKLQQVAEHHQVFAITHLPQIASRAHVHLLVQKQERDGAATTELRALDHEKRIAEIARMLGGDPESTVSREHARELLERGGVAAG